MHRVGRRRRIGREIDGLLECHCHGPTRVVVALLADVTQEGSADRTTLAMANQGELRSCSSFQLSGLSPDLADLVSRSPAPSIFPEGAPQYIPGLLGRTGSPTQVGPGRGRRMCLAGLFVSKPSPGPVTVGVRTRVTCLCCPPTSADVSRRSLRSLLSWLLTLSMIFPCQPGPLLDPAIRSSMWTQKNSDVEVMRQPSDKPLREPRSWHTSRRAKVCERKGCSAKRPKESLGCERQYKSLSKKL